MMSGKAGMRGAHCIKCDLYICYIMYTRIRIFVESTRMVCRAPIFRSDWQLRHNTRLFMSGD
jgi:hypothetical protein